MINIEGSVGQNGDNLERDVLVVQQLLNRQHLEPLAKLSEDGRVGASTIVSIRHFQVRYLGMNSPDGRVDPNGRTIRKLNTDGARSVGENAETRKADRDERAKRVDSRVKENATTTRIIDALVPRFQSIRARIIAGLLSDSDQYWKVNYHWEYLIQMVEHSLTLALDGNWKKELQSVRGSLLSCKPDPSSGYTTSPVGRPEDRSTSDEVDRRYKLLCSNKQAFAKIIVGANLKSKSRMPERSFDLAAARVAPPGKSKHGTGYALDIEGDNNAIRSLCKQFGASLVFDESSHVHVEFKNGVNSSSG